jgi:predicted methyltransferase
VASRPTGNRPPPQFPVRISILRERTIIDNREKIIEVLRRSPLTPLTYSNIKATADVPVGSFDRTLSALVRDGTVLKGDDGYRLADDGSAIEPEKTRVESGIRVYCARCEGSHPSPDKARGETFEDVHRRAIAP